MAPTGAILEGENRDAPSWAIGRSVSGKGGIGSASALEVGPASAVRRAASDGPAAEISGFLGRPQCACTPLAVGGSRDSGLSGERWSSSSSGGLWPF